MSVSETETDIKYLYPYSSVLQTVIAFIFYLSIWVTEMICITWNQHFMVLLDVREFTIPGLRSRLERIGNYMLLEACRFRRLGK